MDVLFYWKDVKADLAAGRLGQFESSRIKLGELHEGKPTRIWVIKTPTGRKGEVQLLARLHWLDKPREKNAGSDANTTIFYDASHPDSVWFEDTDTDAAVNDMTRWVRRNFPVAIQANFRGDNAVHALRGDLLTSLSRMAGTYATRPFEAVTS